MQGAESWLNYPLGVLAAFPEFGWRVPEGFDYLALSDLPSGAGLSSSAAIELASGLVFLEASGDRAKREDLVKACRHAENNFVGVPCGILDQGVSGFGRKDNLVFIDCRGPAFSLVPLPAASSSGSLTRTPNTHWSTACTRPGTASASRQRGCWA